MTDVLPARAPAAAGASEDRYHAFRDTGFFPALDTLRTVSVVLVVAFHMQDPVWAPLKGFLGVTVFFVISGFLITTLLLREESRSGRVSLRGFYVRRAFRLLPLYYVVLLAFALPILVFGATGQVEEFRRQLPYYLSYQNDFAGAAPFGHSWSLAIEEKFYLLWPALGFGAAWLGSRHRTALCVALLVLTTAAAWTPLSYLAIYTPIVAGCLLALLMHDERGFRRVEPLTSPTSTAVLVVVAVALAAFEDTSRHHPVFALAVALALPGLLLGRGWVRSVTHQRVAVSAGRLTYAAYLVHPLCKSSVDELLDLGQRGVLLGGLRLALTLALTFTVAWLLHGLVERPGIELGRRWSASTGPSWPPRGRRRRPRARGHRASPANRR